MNIEQVFFGNDGLGYRVLASTSDKFSLEVEILCNMIGTPDGFSEVTPFLISVPRGEWLYMVCGRPGPLDASGRKTLFFHALVAERRQAATMNVNAFSLEAANCFTTIIPKQLRAVTIDIALPPGESNSRPIWLWHGGEAAIVSKRPENNLLRSLLSSKVNAVAWATFSFLPLEHFHLYVISEFVRRPQDRECYTRDGQNIVTRSEKGSDIANTGSCLPTSSRNRRVAILALLLGLSLAVNLIQWWRWPTHSPISTLPEINQEDDLARLREMFPQDARIENWEAEASDRIKKLFQDSKDSPFLRKAKQYVDFVNEKILFVDHQPQEPLP